MPLEGTVDVIKGVPYFRHDDGGTYDEPMACICWWKLPKGATRFEGMKVVWSNTGGEHYSIYDGGRKVCEFPAPKGEKPARSEMKPIPPPKTRLETRWRAGRWEKKYAKGWR